MAWPHRRDKAACFRRIAQIGGMPPHAVVLGTLRIAADRVDFAILQLQPRQTVAAEKTGRPGDQDAGHRTKSGQDASRSAIVVGANGHSIPKAGSFQRTPAAASGWNTSPII